MIIGGFFEVRKRGVFREVSLPVFGQQDVGVSPGGAMDGFALECGNVLLGNPSGSPALEMLLPPTLRLLEPVLFTLTGAPLPGAKLQREGATFPLLSGTVYPGNKGDTLSLGTASSGLRSYLCFRPVGSSPDVENGRSLGNLDHLFDWVDQSGMIRVTEAPETGRLHDPEAFFQTFWTIGRETNDMGMRLTSPVTLQMDRMDMISEAVSTGTIQLTPEGPIVLLKNRQTLGGYPRIFAVISADVDLLAQKAPGETLRFRKVTIGDAWKIARKKAERIRSLRMGQGG